MTFCPTQELADEAWRLFGSIPQGWRRVQAINDWVHSEISFGYLQTALFATARPTSLRARAGVQGLRHLAVTFCRAVDSARYAFGYLPDIGVPLSPDPMDFADGGAAAAWWTFDPRNNQRRLGRVLIGRGRDALDVAMISTYGGPRLASMTVWADQVVG